MAQIPSAKVPHYQFPFFFTLFSFLIISDSKSMSGKHHILHNGSTRLNILHSIVTTGFTPQN